MIIKGKLCNGGNCAHKFIGKENFSILSSQYNLHIGEENLFWPATLNFALIEGFYTPKNNIIAVPKTELSQYKIQNNEDWRFVPLKLNIYDYWLPGFGFRTTSPYKGKDKSILEGFHGKNILEIITIKLGNDIIKDFKNNSQYIDIDIE